MYRTVLLIFIIFLANTFFCQATTLTKPQVVNSNEKVTPEAEKATVIESLVTKTYLIKNEEYYTKFISALEGKKKHLQSDSALNIEAKSIGWYTKINGEIEKAKVELLKLKKDD